MHELDIQTIKNQLSAIIDFILTKNTLKPEHILILGCSTSEISGSNIGKSPTPELGEIIITEIIKLLEPHKIFLAIQCCEHLNRCLVIERACQEKYGLEEVLVRPVPKAGGSAASAGIQIMQDPVVVESIQAHAGIDIGDTFIGMHLKPVAVPLRMNFSQIGYAHFSFAITRPKLIGGSRANYA